MARNCSRPRDDPGPFLLVPEVGHLARRPAGHHLLVQLQERTAHHAGIRLAEPRLHAPDAKLVDVVGLIAGGRDPEVHDLPVIGGHR
jgi:hypothetical protein